MNDAMKRDPAHPAPQRLALRRLKRLGGVLLGLALLLGLAYLATPQWLLRADAWRRAYAAELRLHSITAGDTRWSYYEGGNGPTIVLLHGFGVDKRIWLAMAPLLTPRFHLVIPDLPGWGESSRIDGADYDIEAQATRFDAFVQALGLSRFMLVGHSLGGAIAGVYAADHPQVPAGLVLMDSYGLSFEENDFARSALAGGANPFVYDDRAGLQRTLELGFARPPKIPGRFMDAMVADNVANRAFIERNFDRLRRLDQYDILDARLPRLGLPVLALWGRDDRIIDPSAIDTLRQGLRNAPSIDVSLISDCGHSPEVEQPAATARILADFTLRH